MLAVLDAPCADAAKTMTSRLPPVCMVGHHDPDYPRHQTMRDAIEADDRTVHVYHSRAPYPLRHLVLAARQLVAPRAARVVLVTEGGHRLVPWVKLVSRLLGRRVMFDPFISRYDTRVEDRQWFAPGSLEARIAHFHDWAGTHAADFLLFDTEEHRQYFFERYGLDKPSAVVPVGVPEDLFTHVPEETLGARSEAVDVLFYGTYIPLQGIETILRAAALLAGRKDISLTLVGGGQTEEAMRALATELALAEPQVRFVAPVPFDSLPARIAEARVTLGIFGTTAKAARVVPNKVVQAAAVGRAIVTADTPAIRRYFVHGESAYLVPTGDAEALAAAIRELVADADMRQRLGHHARRVFEASFSRQAATRTLSEALSQLEAR